MEGYIEVALVLDEEDTLFVNEEGLFVDPQYFFEIKGGHQPFAGNGVIAGADLRTGESVDAKSSLAYIKSIVRFLGEKNRT